MKYYILDSKEDLFTCLDTCYNAYTSSLNNAPEEYVLTTTSWALEQTRITDGKYIVPYLDALGDSIYTVEESSPSWFPEEDF
jgi:hypothetical protein